MPAVVEDLANFEMTRGERFEVARRQAGWTQQATADLFGVNPSTLAKWEADKRRPAPVVRLDELRPADWCFVQRRRSGLRQKQLAELSGFSAAWIRKAEHGETDAGPLARWWRMRLDGAL